MVIQLQISLILAGVCLKSSHGVMTLKSTEVKLKSYSIFGYFWSFITFYSLSHDLVISDVLLFFSGDVLLFWVEVEDT